MTKHTVTVSMTIAHTYEIDLESESYAFAKGDLDMAVQQDVAATHDDPLEWLASLEQCDIKVVGWDRDAEGHVYGRKLIELEDMQQDGRVTAP